MEDRKVTLSAEQALYVIPAATGYSCLGFDVCIERARRLAVELGQPAPAAERGTMAAYDEYQRLVRIAWDRNRETGWRSESELVPELIGLEGKRVEVVDKYGETRRFYVGKSTGFIPCHLEIARRNSHGGPAVMGTPFKSVRVVGSR